MKIIVKHNKQETATDTWATPVHRDSVFGTTASFLAALGLPEIGGLTAARPVLAPAVGTLLYLVERKIIGLLYRSRHRL